LFGDAPEPLFAAAALLPGHEAQPCSHLPPVFELPCRSSTAITKSNRP
jgi:hypothetical protein